MIEDLGKILVFFLHQAHNRGKNRKDYLGQYILKPIQIHLGNIQLRFLLVRYIHGIFQRLLLLKSHFLYCTFDLILNFIF